MDITTQYIELANTIASKYIDDQQTRDDAVQNMLIAIHNRDSGDIKADPLKYVAQLCKNQAMSLAADPKRGPWGGIQNGRQMFSLEQLQESGFQFAETGWFPPGTKWTVVGRRTFSQAAIQEYFWPKV